jgi:predicted nuclease of predicted toxin-antitoxin system
MRLLTDVGVSRSTAEDLRRGGHDVLHLSEVGLNRLPDDEILILARRESRTIVTFDLDFGDLLAAGAHPLPSVILFRLRDPTPLSATSKLFEILSERETDLVDGALILVEDRRYRVRRLPIQR